MKEKIKIIKADNKELMQLVLMIRKKVFTGEQGISEQLDNDGKDAIATNLLLYVNEEVAGTGRVLIEAGKGVLARIAVLPKFRGKGYAKIMINELEKYGLGQGVEQFELYPHSYLQNFYESVGYVSDEQKGYEVAGHKLIRMFKSL